LKKFLFIVNPVSGGGRWHKVEKTFNRAAENNAKIDKIICRYPGHAKEIAESMKRKYEVIVAVGGDGTVHEVLNGIGEKGNNIFGVLPIGSGNDFARLCGHNENFEENLKNLLYYKSVKYFNIGRVSFTEHDLSSPLKSYIFINSLGIGFDAFAAWFASQNRRLNGLPKYLAAVLKALFLYKPLEAEAEFDGVKFAGLKLLFAIGNGKTSGGGFPLNPLADPCDGLLDACFADAFSITRILKFLPMAVTGRHINKSGINNLTFSSGKIKLNNAAHMHIEGEVVSKNLKEAFIEILTDRLSVIVK
jgi:YegS/Rv2252/BmrU family lipid kinase